MLFTAIASTLIVGIIAGIFIERNNSSRVEKLINQALQDAKTVKDDASKIAADIKQ